MSIISEAYIMRRLNQFLDSDAGKSAVYKVRPDLKGKNIVGGSGNISREEATRILTKICEEFKGVVRSTIASFRLDAIHAKVDGFDESGRLRASISVDSEALERASLHRMNSGNTISHGEGVHDILALFANGYSLSKRPYGFWVREGGNSMVRIGALMHREPDPFLTEFVNELNTEYAGKCIVTLNDKYKTQGGG